MKKLVILILAPIDPYISETIRWVKFNDKTQARIFL
jgi:hypothetical protein